MSNHSITKTELQLAALLLELASEAYSHHICNDFSLEFLPLEKRQKLIKAMHEWNEDPEEYDPNFVNGCHDYFLMSYLSAQLKKASEKL